MVGAIASFKGEHRFLSNFYPAAFIYGGYNWACTECAYQAHKEKDLVSRVEFVRLTAGQAKRRGRLITLRDDWDEVKMRVMLDVNRLKFAIPELQRKLIMTGSADLVKGNTWGDRFWGVCEGEGENNLGKILMQIRNEIGVP